MAPLIRLAVSQSHTLTTTTETLDALSQTCQEASTRNIDVILFPEAYLGGYPRGCNFGSVVGSRSDQGRDQYLQYWNQAVDLGDTARGGGEEWIKRRLPGSSSSTTTTGETGNGVRGDGTRERLEKIAKETGVFICTGLVEKTPGGGSLYCSVVYVCPKKGVIGKRRKVLPTGTERLIWAQGSPSTLKAVVTEIKGVRITIGCAICWENYMPLLRQSLYEQGVNLWLAPTADARATWPSLTTTIALEGRCFVLSANQCLKQSSLPSWQQAPSSPPGDPYSTSVPSGASGEEWVSSGGSHLTHPLHGPLTSPLFNIPHGPETLIWRDVDFDDCIRGRLDFDAAGSYSRNDAFHLRVQGLELTPPVME